MTWLWPAWWSNGWRWRRRQTKPHNNPALTWHRWPPAAFPTLSFVHTADWQTLPQLLPLKLHLYPARLSRTWNLPNTSTKVKELVLPKLHLYPARLSHTGNLPNTLTKVKESVLQKLHLYPACFSHTGNLSNTSTRYKKRCCRNSTFIQHVCSVHSAVSRRICVVS